MLACDQLPGAADGAPRALPTAGVNTSDSSDVTLELGPWVG